MNEAILPLRGVQLSIVLAIQACTLIYNAVLQLLQPYIKYCTTLHHLLLQHCSTCCSTTALSLGKYSKWKHIHGMQKVRVERKSFVK